MSYRVQFTDEASEDLHRYFIALAALDPAAAQRAMHAITKSIEMLEDFPFSCRKADPENSLLRELVINFGEAGYVALYEITDHATVRMLAIRHQREDDYY